MWYPPTFLALPLEIRHNIYSYLLVGQGMPHLVDLNMFRDPESRSTRRGIFHSCRKLYQEAFDYYYANNTFMLSLITPHYSIRELASESDILLRRLQRVRSLILVVETSEEQRRWADTNCSFSYDTKYPKQQQQWMAFVDVMLRSKGNAERLLKDLTIEDWGLPKVANDILPTAVVRDTAVYSKLLTPLSDRIDQIDYVRGPWPDTSARSRSGWVSVSISNGYFQGDPIQ